MVPIVAILMQAAAPQTAPPPASPTIAPPGKDIVVTARPMQDRRESQRFVRTLAPRLDHDVPMARFDAPVCIAAGGLPRPILTAISGRMADVATSAGLTMAKPDCTPNVLVLFTGEPRRQIRPLLRQRPAFFIGVDRGMFLRLSKTSGPVVAWSTIGLANDNGSLSVDNSGVVQNAPFQASRLSTPVRRTIGVAVVLIDRDATAGLTSRQLADYAAMRAFADARPTTDARSILSLFDAPVAPDAASTYDLAYLNAYYRMPPDRNPGAQRQALTRAISSAR